MTVDELAREVHDLDVRLARAETQLGWIAGLLRWVLAVLTGNLLAVVAFGLLLTLRR